MVRMYVCGITPYDSTHLGHAATYLTYDLLIRRLEELGHEVRMVRNITDVDDSILPKARELGVPYLELAAAEIARFQGDMAALELRPPVAEPRATDAVPQIIELVGQLLDSGHAYLSGGYRVLRRVDVPRLRQALALSRRPDDQARARRAAAIPTIRTGAHPLDFVLWQPSLADEPAWRAPFGVGRPGLAHRVLGDGDARARPDPRPPRRRHRPHLPAPRVRDRAERVAHRRAVRAALDALGDGQLRGREDVEVARQPRVRQRPAEGRRPARDPPRADAPPLPLGFRVVRHRSRRGGRAAAPPARRGRAPDGPDPAPFAQRVRDAIDDDLDAPRALEALDDLASAVLSGGDRHRARPRCCASSARCSASTSAAPIASARRLSASHDGRGTRHEPRASPLLASMIMSEQITVTLPDGSAREVETERRRPTSRPRSGPGWRRRRWRRKADGEWIDLDRPLDHDVKLAIVTPDRADGREVLRHSTAHVLAEAVTRAVPRRQVRDRSRDRRRLLLRLRAARRQDLHEDDLEPIEAEMRAIVKQDERFVREELALRRRARRCSPTSRTSARSSRRCAPAMRRRGRGRGRRATTACRSTATSSTATATLRRPVPRARTCRRRSGWARSSSRRSRARTGGATRRARCSSASTAPRGSRRKRSPSTCTASRRPSGATTASSASSSTCSRSPRRSARASRCSTRRARSSARIMEEYSRQRHETSGYEFVNSPHITQGRPVRDVGPPRLVRRRHVPAHAPRRGRRRRGHDLLPQADELPVPRPDLPAPHAFVPRAAAAPVRVRHACTATRSRASCTASPACAA